LGLAILRSNPDAQGSRIRDVNNSTKEIFIAGGSGYMGRHLIPELLARGHRVKALVRRGSESKIALAARW
jgi:nucleoside-diphosphate-sugar epimerase